MIAARTAARRWTISRETSSMERRERANGASPGQQRARSPTGPRPGPTRRRASPARCSSRPTCCPWASRATMPAAARKAMRRRYRLLLTSPSHMCRRTARLTRTRSSFRTQAAPRTRVSPRARVFGQSPGCSPARLVGGYAEVTGTLTSVSLASRLRERRRHLWWATGMIAGVALLGVGAVVVIEIAAGTGHPVAKAHHAGVVATASGQGTACGLSSQAQGRHGDKARASGEREGSRTPRRQAATSTPPRDAPTPILIAQAPGRGAEHRCVARRSPGERGKHRIV